MNLVTIFSGKNTGGNSRNSRNQPGTGQPSGKENIVPNASDAGMIPREGRTVQNIGN